MRSATSGKQALEMMKTSPFDVVVADLRMPVMSGVELMAEICRQHPQTSRVILSGIRDQEQVARCLGATHQFVPKPVDLETLHGTGARICALDMAFHHTPARSNLRSFGPLTVVHIADVLEGEQSKTARPTPVSGFDNEYFTALKIQDQLEDWRRLAHRLANPAPA